MNLLSNEELKARRQSRCAQRGQRFIFALGALLATAALGVGAAAVLEAQAIQRVSVGERPHRFGVVTIASAGGLAFGTGEVVSERESANRERYLHARLQTDVILDVHDGGARKEISISRIGRTDVAVLRFPSKSMDKRGGAAEAHKLVQEASFGADLVVVMIEAGTRGPRSRDQKPGWKRPEALTPVGAWIEGRLLPLRLSRAEYANLSLAADTFGVIRAKSCADFGTSTVRVLRNGSLRPPSNALS